jgi:TRAP-type uncharacterized transport system fused permease subunit
LPKYPFGVPPTTLASFTRSVITDVDFTSMSMTPWSAGLNATSIVYCVPVVTSKKLLIVPVAEPVFSRSVSVNAVTCSEKSIVTETLLTSLGDAVDGVYVIVGGVES